MSNPELPNDLQGHDSNNAAPPYYPAQAPVNANVSSASKPLSIVALVLSFLLPLVGLILGIVALVQAKKAGEKSGMALAATIIGSVLTVLSLIVTAVLIGGLLVVGDSAMEATAACEAGATSVEVYGQTLDCETLLQR